MGWQVAQRCGSRPGGTISPWFRPNAPSMHLFAIFPALSALISLYVLTTAPATVEDQFSMLSSVLPTEAYDIVIQQIRTLAESPNRTLGWSFVLFISLLADHRHCPLAAARAAGAWPASRALSLRAVPAKSEMGVG